jgi:hypothetical protein
VIPEQIAIRKLLTDEVEKKVFFTLHQQVKTRIFDQGQDASGSQIGRYSKAYLKKRSKKGYSGDKVVLEFTGQMKNDFQLVANPQGGLSSGFLNKHNGDKSFWVEETYGKEIFKLTAQEIQLIDKLYDAELNRILNES